MRLFDRLTITVQRPFRSFDPGAVPDNRRNALLEVWPLMSSAVVAALR